MDVGFKEVFTRAGLRECWSILNEVRRGDWSDSLSHWKKNAKDTQFYFLPYFYLCIFKKHHQMQLMICFIVISVCPTNSPKNQ